MLASLLMNFLLRRRGYDVVYLGADVPLENFRTTIEELEPDMVILTAHLLITAAGLLDLANELEGVNSRLAYGGPIFHRIPELRRNFPGGYLGDDLKKESKGDIISPVEIVFENIKHLFSQKDLGDFGGS